MRLDPVMLEIMATKAAAAAEEMGTTLQRTGRTLYVKETSDFAAGLVRADGLIFAYPQTVGVAYFVALNCGATIRAVPELDEGDVIITNHPYLSEGLATHLPDLHLIQPYFHDGKIICYGWCIIHCTDIGGRVPSSISPTSSEIFQEGLMIPPMKALRRGAFNPDLIALLMGNSRTPDDNIGDLRAALACLNTGRQRVADMIVQHGVDDVMACQDDLIAYTAAKARDALRKLPDGSYDFWDYLDDDMVSNIPVRLRLKMTVADGLVMLDFTGSDPESPSAINMPTSGKPHVWLTVQLISFICTMDKTILLNGGLLDPISVIAPAGTVVHAEFPAAVGIRTVPGKRIMDCTLGVIHQAVPGLVPAPRAGCGAPLAFAEYDLATGKRNILVIQFMIGSTGARKGHDGIDGRDASLGNLANNPLEMVEADAGVIVREYGIRADSGGPGQWRGGASQQITFEVVRDGGLLAARGMERLRFRPYGVAGGKPGATLRSVLNIGTPGEREMGKIDALELNTGDTLTVMMPAGGGYGDPLLREVDAVLLDVRRGYVTAAAAERDYGVVIHAGAIDAAATEKLRGERRQSEPAAMFDFGRERLAWEAVFDDDSMNALNRLLFGLPKSQRNRRRQALFAQVVPDLPRAGDAGLDSVMTDVPAMKARLQAAMGELAQTVARYDATRG